MINNLKPEPWLRGSLPDIPPLLQPVAHALMQAVEDIHLITQNFNEQFLWVKPAGRASVGFHLQHICGVLDRMITYAQEKTLTEKQLDELSDEGQPFRDIHLSDLLQNLETQFEKTLDYLKTINETSLTEKRTVGRKKLSSTVIGLLFHAAEHAQRHVGQLLVTASMVQNNPETDPKQ